MSDVEKFRRRAAECERQAAATASLTARDLLQDIASKYLALAVNEERAAAMSAAQAQGSLTREPRTL